ncbi:restriction endonuclease subunit S [Vibrio breoganii]|uniref:restriction endonuclease subunit S n=1 Tax=Vibrio breoganii TaxID=553239 RepID=UPI000CAC72FE|nr:restriction endonuclease subunit S [Vibrio breoganii]PMK62550.1 hypothetical protein BCT98_04625 [Vibrio breoganii]
MLNEYCETMFAGAPSSFFNKEVSGDQQTYKALKSADISKDGYINAESMTDIEVKEGKNISKFVLKEGDVVLLARGTTPHCGFVTEEVAQLGVVATANFIVIRLKPNFLGECLTAYFNSQYGKQSLNHPDITQSTSVMKAIKLSALKQMELKLPSILKQKQIADLFHAQVKAERATLEMLEKQKAAVEAKVVCLMEEGK